MGTQPNMPDQQTDIAARDHEPQGERRQVLVVGGYGQVGRLICQHLSARTDNVIVVAGRDIAKAGAFASSIGRRGVRLDLGDPGTWEEACRGVDWVVMCMDQKDASFVSFLFERGIHYIDITASDGLFRAIEHLAPMRSTALLSVGLAPGLTNILAFLCASRLDRADRVEIGLLFGLGDDHGDAAIEWMADQLFAERRETQASAMLFGFGVGRRMAYPVDFSDQHCLRRTLPVDTVTTRIAFETRWATWGIFALGRIFAGNRFVRKLTAGLFKRVRVGCAICNVSVAATGWHHGKPAMASAHFAGDVEARTTAGLSALQIEQFLDRPVAPGVWHSHQVLDAETMIASVTARGIGRVTIDPVCAEGEGP
jgi:NAD(P)-dependent dehydrogenase (short-subunit alcohol dehydrogenase family)